MKTGIFDSGIGGLNVLYEALRQMPNEEYVYFADTDNVPYGNKDKVEIRGFVLDAAAFLASLGVDALVLACNTATSVAVENLRTIYQFPVIGMEPAVKPAVSAAHGKRVLVFATELTLKEEKFKNLVRKVDVNQQVDYLPLQELVTYAENFIFDDSIILPYLQDKLSGIDLANYSTSVLGCTHFPYFKKALIKILPKGIDIIDGTEGTVNNLKTKLASIEAAGKGSFNSVAKKRNITYYRSKRLVSDTACMTRYLDLIRSLEERT